MNELEIIDPTVGELIDRRDMPKVAEAINRIRTAKQQLNDAIAELTLAVIEESQRVGTKTIYAGKTTLELSPDYETQWDVTELVKLIDLGLPIERYEDLVNTVITHKVDGRVAKQISSSNEHYREIIDRAQTKTPKTQYVRVKRS